MQFIIIGAGPAGVIAAETLRKVDPDSEVKIIGDESEPPYSRMALPYYLLERIGEDGTYLRKNSGHYEDKGIELVQDRVTQADTSSKTL